MNELVFLLHLLTSSASAFGVREAELSTGELFVLPFLVFPSE